MFGLISLCIVGMWLCLFGPGISRHISGSRTKVFVCGFMGLILYCVVVIELGSPGQRISISRQLNQCYNSVSLARVQQELCRPSRSQSFTTNDVQDEGSNDVIRERFSDTLYCANPSRGILPGIAEEFLEDPFAWQRVSGRAHETYVFSAYYDNRLSPAMVVIVGISDRYEARKSASARGKEMCRMWFSGDAKPEVVKAEFNFVAENHGHRYAASLHSCPIERNDSIPNAVSLIVDRCRQSRNILRVQNYSDQKKRPTVNYTVCVSPLINSYNNYHQLIESVEVNRIFGAEEFVFYNFSADSVVFPFLNSYLEEGIARIIPWNIPLVDIHYFGQVAALNDCLYRSMFRSRFLVFTDLDELIVPRRHRSWDEMLGAAVEKMKGGEKIGVDFPVAFIFRSTIFTSRWFNDSRATADTDLIRVLGLKSLMLNVRETRIFPFNSRTKYIARSVMFQTVGIHLPFKRAFRTVARTVYMDTNLGLVHHYRIKRLAENKTMESVVDATVFRFHELIVSRTKDIYRRVGETSNWSIARLPVD